MKQALDLMSFLIVQNKLTYNFAVLRLSSGIAIFSLFIGERCRLCFGYDSFDACQSLRCLIFYIL